MSLRSRARGLMLGFLASGSLLTPVRATTSEAWVVNGGGRSISIIDADLEAVTGTLLLSQGPGAVAPRGLAFSTIDGAGGAFAFVGQGSQIHVIDAAMRVIVDTVDVGTLLGLPTSLVDLTAAQNRDFQTGTGPAVEAYLYAAADVSPGTLDPPEPYYLIFDQRVLVGLAPPGTSPIVDFGPLLPPAIPAANRGTAIGVSVLGAPQGDLYQRAWFTTRAIGPPEVVRSILLARTEIAGSPWAVAATKETVLAAGVHAPDSFTVAVPYDREFPVLPTGESGRLINLDGGGECNLGGDLRYVAISGPGPGGYQLLVLDGATESVQRVNPVSCAVESFEVGSDPVAVAIDAAGQHGKAFVANRGSDSVTVLRLDGTLADVALGPGLPGDCVLCPAGIQIRRCCPGCTVKGLTVTKAGVNDNLAWTRVGCVGCTVGVFCQCQDGQDPQCPCYCTAQDPTCYASLPPGARSPTAGPSLLDVGPLSETPWKHLGNSLGGTFTHTGAGTYGLNYVVLPVP